MIDLDKYKIVEKKLSETIGPFNLFALFLREGSPAKWDLLVSAEWLEDDKQKGIRVIAEKLQEMLPTDELINLSRIVVIEMDNPSLENIWRTVSVNHGNVEIKDSNFFGLEIKHAFIITSQRKDQEEKVS